MGVEEQESEHVISPVSDYLGVLARLRRKTERVWQERFLDGLESGANTLIHLCSLRSVPGGTPLRLSYLYKQSRGWDAEETPALPEPDNFVTYRQMHFYD